MSGQDRFLKDGRLIAAHYGEEMDRYYNSIVPPIFMNSLNTFDTIDDYYDSDKADKHTYCYGRVQNPTTRILEDKLGALEHGCGAFAFSSGMAAATTAVLAVCRAGSHVVCVRNAYGPLKTFLTEYCKEHLDMETTFVQGNTVAEFEEAVNDHTDLIVLESPSSVVFSLQDIRAVAAIGRKHGARTYIDNTFCTPVFQNPLDMGVDLVMHTMSKYIGGHSDIIGGVLTSRDEGLMKKISVQRELLGGILGPMESWLAIRGLRTLDVRVRSHESSALEVAAWLEKQERIRAVYYPGLPSHPQYELMKSQQMGNTGLLSFELDGSVEQAKKLVQSLSIFKIGVSWGGFESLVCMPHARQTEEMCKFLGASQNVVRIHCGLEGASNLIEDLETSLSHI